MCTASTAKRKRSQARKEYRHLAPLARPHYTKTSSEASARKAARARAQANISYKKKG